MPNGPNMRAKHAVHRNHPRYNDDAQVLKEDDSKKKAAASSGATPKASKAAIQLRHLANELKRGLWPPIRCSLWLHDAAEDWKRICCSTCGQAISFLSEQGQVRARQQAST